MNELNLGVSIEDVIELIASYSELMLNEDFIDIQQENEMPLEAVDAGSQSPPTKTLIMRK